MITSSIMRQGFVLGLARLTLEAMRVDAGLFTEINFLHFAILLFVICTAVLVVVSLATAPPSREQIAGLTFATAKQETLAETQDARISATAVSTPSRRRLDVVLSILVVVLVGLVWVIFS